MAETTNKERNTNMKNEYLWLIEGKSSGGSTGFSLWAESFEQAYILGKEKLDKKYLLVSVKLLDLHETIYLHNCGK